MNLLFISDIVNLLLKTNGERQKTYFCYFCSLECFNCWWVDGAGVRQKILFRASFVFMALFRHVVSARSRSVRGAFHQPAFMGSCLTINHTCLPCLPSRQVKRYPCVTEGGKGGGGGQDLRVGLCSLAYVEGLWMIKLVVAGFLCWV